MNWILGKNHGSLFEEMKQRNSKEFNFKLGIVGEILLISKLKWAFVHAIRLCVVKPYLWLKVKQYIVEE